MPHECFLEVLIPATIETTLANAQALEHRFRELARDVPYEARGVTYSEMLFLWATAQQAPPRRVVESGRARGQSTHLLALCFPELPVLSIERDAESPDDAVARGRLAGLPNVELLHGDAREMLPALVRHGDLVLIDGPKGRKSLELALRLLETGDPGQVFVHDCYRGSFERRFIEREMGSAIFSDHHEFVAAHRHLDERIWNMRPVPGMECWRPYLFQGRTQESYSATLACLSPDQALDLPRVLRRLGRFAFLDRLRKSLRKRLSRGGRA